MHETINTMANILNDKRTDLAHLEIEKNILLTRLCEKQEKVNFTIGQINRLERELKTLQDITYGSKMSNTQGDQELSRPSITSEPKTMRKES